MLEVEARAPEEDGTPVEFLAQGRESASSVCGTEGRDEDAEFLDLHPRASDALPAEIDLCVSVVVLE